MIILGLGTNIGNRLQHLRNAYRAIKKISGVTITQVSPVYTSEAELKTDAPPEWNQPFLNCALSCESTLSPDNLFSKLKQIETDLGRDPHHLEWSPRIIDIDILIWHDQIISTDHLSIPHPRFCQRPFALWPLADIMPLWLDPLSKQTAEQLIEPWGSRYDGKAPFHTRQINQRIDTPALVGVINVTPDSFSDGGKFTTAEQAFHQAVHLMEAGAEILDIGAESTAPNRTALTPAQEWQRLEPVLTTIMRAKSSFNLPPLISIDTRHAEVAKEALSLNVDWINDVTGFNDPAMCAAVRGSKADCVVMHHITIPPSQKEVIPRDLDPVAFLYRWCEQQINLLEQAGIDRHRLILDPGLGFGKTAGQSLMILKHIKRFEALGVRILIGHSRKSFMAAFSPYSAPERDIETQAISQYLMRSPVDYLRVHHVENMARAFRVQAALGA